MGFWCGADGDAGISPRSRTDRHRFSDEVTELLAAPVQQRPRAWNANGKRLIAASKNFRPKQRTLVQTAYAPGARIDALAEQLSRTAMSLYKTLHRIRLALLECTKRTLAQEELG